MGKIALHQFNNKSSSMRASRDDRREGSGRSSRGAVNVSDTESEWWLPESGPHRFVMLTSGELREKASSPVKFGEEKTGALPRRSA